MRDDPTDRRTAYMNQLFGREDAVLQAVVEQLKKDEKLGVNVSANEGAILNFLVTLSKATRVVEVGTLYGYSALWIARALPENGQLYCVEKSEENYGKALEFISQSEVSDKVQLILGEGNSVLPELNNKGPFDLIFIDANKGEYKRYLDWAIENVESGGVIVGDNTFLFGHVYGEPVGHSNMGTGPIEAMKEFNRILANSDEFVSCMLPTGEGMTVAVKK